MSHGLEARAPFVDHDVVELGAALPGRFKLRNGKGKHILKQAFADLVPAAILERKKKGSRCRPGAGCAGRLHGFARELLLSDAGARARPVRAGARSRRCSTPPRRRGSRRTDLEPHGARDLVPRARRRPRGLRARGGGAPGRNCAVRRSAP